MVMNWKGDFQSHLLTLVCQSHWRKLMEPWCGDIMGKHISSVEPCIGSKEHYMHSCVHLIVGGFGFGSVDFLCTLTF